MEQFVEELKEKIGDKLFLSPMNLVKLGVFGSYASIHRIVTEKEIPHFRHRSAIRIYTKDLIEYLRKNFHEVEEK